MMQSWADYIDALQANTDLAAVNKIGRESVVAAMRAIPKYESLMISVSVSDRGQSMALLTSQLVVCVRYRARDQQASFGSCRSHRPLAHEVDDLCRASLHEARET